MIELNSDPLKPTLVVIDDHELFRQGLESLLMPSFTIAGVGETSADAVRLSRELDPDILILDVELRSQPAEQTIRRVRRDNPGTSIVILTMFDDPILERQLLRAGASAYATKSIDRDSLKHVLMKALLVGPTAAAYDSGQAAPSLLSQRELEVLRLVAAAASNREIANALTLSEGTVKRHLANIFLKLGAGSRIEAVAKASRHGVL